MLSASILGRILLASTALLLVSRPLPAQGGWATEKHPELGLSFPRAKDYEPIPTQPDDEYRVLHFAERVTEWTREKRSLRPELLVLRFDKRSAVERNLAGDLDTYLRSSYPTWIQGRGTEGKERNGFKSREFSFLPGIEGDEPVVGWICSYLNGDRTIAFLGRCAPEDLRDQVKIWRYTAEHVEFSEPEEPTTDELRRRYSRSALPRADYRIEVRKKLVRGWKAEDTEHYIVVHDTTDQPLVRKIVRDLELLHAEYEKLFPPAEKVDAVSTVRLCKSREEYLTYGGEPYTSGYWNPEAQELVLYDAEKVDRHVRSDADTFVTLYHEGFHQYVFYSCGQVQPHSWFDEGHGDFFSGARVLEGKIWAIGVHPWRVGVAKEIVDFQKAIPWEQIVRFEQKEFYDEKRIAVCYAQAWSMIYFLRKSKVVEKRPEWARILPTYFETLREAYAKETGSLKTPGRKDDRRSIARAGAEARKKAVEAAFEGVDMGELQAAWEKFVRELEIPKRG